MGKKQYDEQGMRGAYFSFIRKPFITEDFYGYASYAEENGYGVLAAELELFTRALVVEYRALKHSAQTFVAGAIRYKCRGRKNIYLYIRT